MKKLSLVVLGLLAMSFGIAQETSEMEDDGFNHQSTKPVHQSDIMYKKTVLRALDLRERQNRPLFSRDREITKLLFDAVTEGLITPYKSDSLDLGSKLTIAEFLKKMELPSAQGGGDDWWGEPAEGEDSDDGFGDFDDTDEAEAETEEEEETVGYKAGMEYYFPKDIYQMQIKEDYIFDKQRSVMYHDIIALNFFIPADHPENIKGIEIPLVSFSYKECVNKLFKTHPDAIWYNPYNDREHKNLHDAFELRLFSSYIIKVSNPSDDYLVDIYGGDPAVGIMASQWKSFELMEYEHNLWEF